MLVVCALYVATKFGLPGEINWTTGSKDDLTLHVLILLIALATAFTLHKYSSFFDSPERSGSHDRKVFSAVWCFVLISIFSSASELALSKHHSREIEKIFDFSVRINVVDDVTGEPLSKIGMTEKGENDSRNHLEISPFQVETAGKEGRGLELRGYAFDDFLIEIYAEGYQNASVTISNATEDEVTARLSPISN